ncbi:MAG: protein kinase [Planctomycetota bacterium]
MIGRIGHYELVRELGRGGMGVVCEGRRDGDGARVAIKLLLDPEAAGATAQERFRREMAACANLEHPNVIRFHGGGLHQGKPYLVMELLQGESLAARVKRQGPLDPDDACRLVCDVAAGLEAAHELGILHRDVKPDNVLLEPPLQEHDASGVGERSSPSAPAKVIGEGARVVLSDFGLARQDGRELERLTRTGQMLGTPSYMAPEQADGALEDLCPATDVYALGATLYCLLTGEPPRYTEHRAESTVELITHLLRSPPIPPSRLRAGIPPAVEAVVLRCLAKTPGERYPSAARFAAALRAAQRAPQPRSQRPPAWALVAGGAALLALGAALAYGTLRRAQARPVAKQTPTSPQAPAPAAAKTPSAEPAGTKTPAISPSPAPARQPPVDRLGQIEAALAARRLDEADAVLKQVPPAEQGARYWYLHGRALQHRYHWRFLTGQHLRMVESFTKALDALGPEGDRRLRRQVLLARSLERFDRPPGTPDWAEDAEQAKRLDPTVDRASIRALFQLAKRAAGEQCRTRAFLRQWAPAFREAARGDLGDVEVVIDAAHVTDGDAQGEGSELDGTLAADALALLQDALEARPDPDLYLALGELWSWRLQVSLEGIKRALHDARDPAQARPLEARLEKGALLLGASSPEEMFQRAMDAYSEALRRAPEHLHARLERAYVRGGWGKVWVRSGQVIAESLADFDALIQLEPDEPVFRWDRASTRIDLGRFEDALEDLEHLTRTSEVPADRWDRRLFVASRVSQERFRVAITDLQREVARPERGHREHLAGLKELLARVEPMLGR